MAHRAKPPAKTAEETDQEELREVEAKIQEILALISAGHTREKVDEELTAARARRDDHQGNHQSVYHQTSQGYAPTTMHTKTKMELAEKLKTRIQLARYSTNLEDSLRRLSEWHVDILERILASRGRR